MRPRPAPKSQPFFGRRIPACAACLCLLLSPCLGATDAPKAPAASEETPKAALSSLDLTQDVRLAAPVTQAIKSQPLGTYLPVLARQVGVPLSVAPDVSGRRVTLFAAKTPLRNVMAGLSAVTGFSWRRDKAARHGYELYRGDAAKRSEDDALAASWKRQQEADQAKHDAIMQAMQESIAGRDPNHPSLADLLASLTPGQLEQAADMAGQPEGVIQVPTNGQLAGNMVGVMPYSQLPPALRVTVDALLHRPEYAPDASGAQHWAGPGTDADLLNSRIGLIAADGSISLGVILPNGNIWATPLDAVAQKGLPGIDSDDDMDPEAEDDLVAAAGSLLKIDSMPDSQYRKRLKFPAAIDRTKLTSLLESVARQTGLCIVSDDFARSHTAPYAWLLTDQDDYATPEALEQIARAYAHGMTFRQGTLRMQTLALGLDLRSEPGARIPVRR